MTISSDKIQEKSRRILILKHKLDIYRYIYIYFSLLKNRKKILKNSLGKPHFSSNFKDVIFGIPISNWNYYNSIINYYLHNTVTLALRHRILEEKKSQFVKDYLKD